MMPAPRTRGLGKRSYLGNNSSHRARVAEWQTRWIQNPVSVRTCGFDSHLWYSQHHLTSWDAQELRECTGLVIVVMGKSMTGEVVRYNVSNGRFAIATPRGYIIAELRVGRVAEGMKVDWEEPVSSPGSFYCGTASVEATIVDVDVPGREMMQLLGPW